VRTIGFLAGQVNGELGQADTPTGRVAGGLAFVGEDIHQHQTTLAGRSRR
jgi:hypothetical protein